MQFDGRGMRTKLNYDDLENFVRGVLHYAFNTNNSEINIVVLRGARPLSYNPPPEATAVVDIPEEVAAQTRWLSNPGYEPEIELVDNRYGDLNDVIIFAWKDADGNKFVRPLLGSADPGVEYFRRNIRDRRDDSTGMVSQGHHVAGRGTHRPGYRCLTFVDRRDAWDPNDGWSLAAYGMRMVPDGNRLRQGKVVPRAYLVSEYNQHMGRWEHCVGQAQLHAGPNPTTDPNDDEVNIHSAGCIIIAGGRAPGSPYHEAVIADESWDLIDNNNDVIVWNAWDYYRWQISKHHPLRRENFNLTLEIGTRDPARDPFREGVHLWVKTMQDLIEKKVIENGQAVEIQDPDGVFGLDTARVLRGFQQVCILHLAAARDMVREVIARQGQGNLEAGIQLIKGLLARERQSEQILQQEQDEALRRPRERFWNQLHKNYERVAGGKKPRQVRVPRKLRDLPNREGIDWYLMYTDSDFQALQNNSKVNMGLLNNLVGLLTSDEFADQWNSPIDPNTLNLYEGLPNPQQASRSELSYLEINVAELQWEYDNWLCGPETWKLLRCHELTIAI